MDELDCDDPRWSWVDLPLLLQGDLRPSTPAKEGREDEERDWR